MRLAILLLVACASAGAQSVQVPYSRIANSAAEPQNWLTYWGDYKANRHSALNQINSQNVKDLRLEWIFQVPVAGRFETVPLVVDGVMYFTAPDGYAFAADARTGRQLWRYRYRVPEKANLINGTVNRGFAMLGDKLYMATPEGRLLCLEARTGDLVWNVEVAPWQKGYGITLAPLAVKDKIIVGVGGGEFGIRGLLDAYDAKSGARVWRFWTIPAPGEPGADTWAAETWKSGGAPTWMTGAYDPELDTLYWGVGNPGPDLYGAERVGDNLYSCSMLALDPSTGKLKWYYQFNPHDTRDWDATETPVLIDLPWKGKPRKLLIQANRNAFFYVLDRETGEFLSATPFARQTWLKQFDAKGRPEYLPNTEPTEDGVRICPGLAGGANWMAPSYDPELKLFFVPYMEDCQIYYGAPVRYNEGKPFWGTTSRSPSTEKSWGVVKAIDPLTGEGKWEFKFLHPGWAGTLSTAGGIVFAGDSDGYLVALDSRSGKLLWKIQTGSDIATAPVTFAVNGRQYVSIASGAALLTFALPEKLPQ